MAIMQGGGTGGNGGKAATTLHVFLFLLIQYYYEYTVRVLAVLSTCTVRVPKTVLYSYRYPIVRVAPKNWAVPGLELLASTSKVTSGPTVY